MAAPSDCPWIERCEVFFDAGLPPSEQQCYEDHLESCSTCQSWLDRVAEDENPLRSLGRAVGDPTTIAADPTLSVVLERLHEVRSPIRGLAEPPELYFLRPSDQPGRLGTLGEYQVSEVIGHGGMGVVLKAFDPPLHRLVAIKVMAPALAGSATARRRFTREAKAAAAVCHDHIVAVHGVNEVDGLPYLVMQYVDGESLQERLDRTGPLEIVEAVRIAFQTAAALAAAHAQGLIHRDIKPANLLLENGLARVKITDFGLARMADDVQLTQNGVVSGTPEYMAPEQARGESVDHRADLFSLGSVLYAMCTGHPPFHGSTAMAVLRQVSDQIPLPVRAVNPDVPEWLGVLVSRLMEKDPAHRFQSAAEVAGLLEGYLAHLRQPLTTPAPILPPSPADAEIEYMSPTPPIRQARWLAAAGVILLSTLGLVAWDRRHAGRMAQVAPGQPDKVTEFYQDFRDKPIHPSLTWSGRDGSEVIEPGEKGLRIRLGADRQKTDPVGLALNSHIEGDVEITTGYEILQVDQPKAGHGVGFELYVYLESATRDGVGLARVKRVNGDEIYVTSHMKTVEEKRLSNVKWYPTKSRSGKLRITRKGNDFILSVAEADGQFRELTRCAVEAGPMVVIRAGAYQGRAAEPVDVRIHDLRVHSPSEIVLPATGDTATVTAATRPAATRAWLVTVELLGVLSTLVLVAIGAWIWVRRGRSSSSDRRTEVEGEPTRSMEQPAVISFACAACGKTLRAGPKLAGLKAKCPQCGKLVVVPSLQKGRPASPDSGVQAPGAMTRNGLIAGAILLFGGLAVLGGWRFLASPRASQDTTLGRSFLDVTVGNEPFPDIEESGFSYQEFDKNDPFRWTNGKARLVIPLRKGDAPKALLVQLRTFRSPGTTNAPLRIAVNDRDVMDGKIPLWKWENVFDLTGMQLGEKVVVDLLSDTFAPQGNHTGDGRISDDARKLGVQVWGIKLLSELPNAARTAAKSGEASKSLPDTTGWHEHYRTFKGRHNDTQGLSLIGPDAEQCVKFEPEGLRITLPAGHPGKRLATGVAWPLPIAGDFEITLGFEILFEPAVKDAGQGTGVFLGVDLNTPKSNRATLTRGARAESGKQFIAWFALTRDDGDKPHADVLRLLPTESRTGRLRIVRMGSILAFFGSEGANGEFKPIYRDAFHMGDVEQIRIGGYTGGPEASLDARLIDLRIRTKARLEVSAAEVQGPLRRSLLAAGGIVVPATGLSMLGLWWFARRSRASHPVLASRTPQQYVGREDGKLGRLS
jgi:serine/threonine protein kinase